MLRLYSQLTGTTYIKGFHSDIPADAVVIDDDRYQEVIGSPAAGKIRSHDADGLPVLIDPPPLTSEQLATVERQWRDREIERIKWLRERHRDEQDLGRDTTLNSERFADLLSYMQLLRDWPLSPAFPAELGRPVEPLWLSQEIE